MSRVLLGALIAAIFFGLMFFAVANRVRIAAEIYLYGYPLVLMEETRKAFIEDPAESREMNSFWHNDNFPDYKWKKVVRPNRDTLYSAAWLDLEETPVILSVPEIKDRYYVMPFMDAWTNVFATVGTRSTGSGPGKFAITGPNWKGKLPEDVVELNSPTSIVWLIGRIQTYNEADIDVVKSLQRKFDLERLIQVDSEEGERYEKKLIMGANKKLEPPEQVSQMPAEMFLSNLARLMDKNPATALDVKVVRQLESYGVLAGEEFNNEKVNWFDRMSLRWGVSLVRSKLHARVLEQIENSRINGWSMSREGIGSYGTNYARRAGVALFGLGALPPQEAMYASIDADRSGQQLSGVNDYRIRFEAGELPPVEAFWSITVYDEQGYLAENELERYSLSDRSSLVFDDDGSITILISHYKPQSNISNWLPAPGGKFGLTLRMYYPEKRLVEGGWQPPSVGKW